MTALQLHFSEKHSNFYLYPAMDVLNNSVLKTQTSVWLALISWRVYCYHTQEEYRIPDMDKGTEMGMCVPSLCH